jgi:hypothetical protein
MNWNDISLRKWKQLERTKRENFEDEILYTAEIIKILFNIDNPMDLSPKDFSKYVNELSFMSNPIPEVKLCNTYNINGTKYNFRGNIFEISMAQLMDVRNFTTKPEVDYAEVLSVFLIPDEHKYNDGYDMEKTLDDIDSLPITDVLKLYNFFSAALILSTDIMTNYFNKELMKTNLTEKEKESIQQKMKEFKAMTDLIFYRTPSVTAK